MVANRDAARWCDANPDALSTGDWWTRQKWSIECVVVPPYPRSCETEGSEDKRECLQWADEFVMGAAKASVAPAALGMGIGAVATH